MKLFLSFILVMSVIVSALQFDEDLSPTAKRWIAVQEERLLIPSDAYLYLLGIVASEDEDVLSIGKNIFTGFKTAEELAGDNLEIVEYELYPEDKKLALPSKESPLFCNMIDEGCVDGILKKSGQWKAVLERHHRLLTRYQIFIDYLEYTTLSRPSVAEVFPEYQYLKYGHRLKLLQILSLYYDGEVSLSQKLLLADVAKLRQQLAVGDSLLHKMFFTQLISNDLELMLLMKADSTTTLDVEVPVLSLAEMDLESSIIREFYMGYSLYKGLDRHPEMLGEGYALPGWIGRMLFKPNMTINDDLPRRLRIIELSRLSAADFSNSVVKSVVEESEISLLNYVGSILNNIAAPDYSIYIARLHDLNAKISLVNYLLSGRRGRLVNPYYPEKIIDVTHIGKICLEGPLVDESNLRCAG